MGRKIPGKKHRGSRDLSVEYAKRDARLQVKINAPPTHPDEQAMPKSLIRLIKLQDYIKQKNKKPQKKTIKNKLISSGRMEGKSVKLRGMSRPEKNVPIFAQKPGESDERFRKRVEYECNDILLETKLENDFKVDIQRDPVTHEVTGLNKNYSQETQAESIRKQKNKRVRDNARKELPLTKKERQKIKEKERKRAKAKLKEEDIDEVQDIVHFGEVAHAPPTLNPPRKSTAIPGVAQRPGRRNLLLKNILLSEKKLCISFPSKASNASLMTKRKLLPVADQRRLERNQQDAVQAYRIMKAQKYLSQ